MDDTHISSDLKEDGHPDYMKVAFVLRDQMCFCFCSSKVQDNHLFLDVLSLLLSFFHRPVIAQMLHNLEH